MEELGETEFVQRISGVEAGGPALTERSAELAVFLANDASGDLSGRLIWVARISTICQYKMSLHRTHL